MRFIALLFVGTTLLVSNLAAAQTPSLEKQNRGEIAAIINAPDSNFYGPGNVVSSINLVSNNSPWDSQYLVKFISTHGPGKHVCYKAVVTTTTPNTSERNQVVTKFSYPQSILCSEL